MFDFIIFALLFLCVALSIFYIVLRTNEKALNAFDDFLHDKILSDNMEE